MLDVSRNVSSEIAHARMRTRQTWEADMGLKDELAIANDPAIEVIIEVWVADSWLTDSLDIDDGVGWNSESSTENLLR